MPGNNKLGKCTLLGGVLLVAGASAFANDVAASRLHAASDADTPRLTAVFKDLHAHPELGFMETRTAKMVPRELTALGFTVQTGIGGTGVVGILHNGPGPIVMYRADMDANAVEEATGLPYASKVRVKRPADGHRSAGGSHVLARCPRHLDARHG